MIARSFPGRKSGVATRSLCGYILWRGQPTLVMLNEVKHLGLEYKLAASGACMRTILPHDLTDAVL